MKIPSAAEIPAPGTMEQLKVHVVSTGKHENLTIKQIEEIDPHYLKWCMMNVGPGSGQNKKHKQMIKLVEILDQCYELKVLVDKETKSEKLSIHMLMDKESKRILAGPKCLTGTFLSDDLGSSCANIQCKIFRPPDEKSGPIAQNAHRTSHMSSGCGANRKRASAGPKPPPSPPPAHLWPQQQVAEQEAEQEESEDSEELSIFERAEREFLKFKSAEKRARKEKFQQEREERRKKIHEHYQAQAERDRQDAGNFGMSTCRN